MPGKNREEAVYQAVVDVLRDAVPTASIDLKAKLLAYFPRHTANDESAIGSVLRTLEALGFLHVPRDGPGRYSEVYPNDTFLRMIKEPDRLRADATLARAGGGNGGFPPGGEPPADGDGGGFRQVLSHPYLFVSDSQDFEEVLARLRRGEWQ